MKVTAQEKAEAIEKLRQWYPPGSTVYTIVRNVSRSGMQREIGVVLLQPQADGSIVDLHPNYLVGLAIGARMGKRDGLIMHGCGTDMGFEIAYHLGRALYQDRFVCSGKDCHSNDHTNGDRNYEPHAHSDAGYALRHRWL